jgi:hypothetical protein
MSDFDKRLASIVSHAQREGALAMLTVLALTLSIANCAHQRAWQVSGESIDALGRTFVSTGHALDAAYDAHRVSEAQYEKWRAFVTYFKPTYLLASDRWLHGDDTASEHAAAVLAALSAELATFALPKGTP